MIRPILVNIADYLQTNTGPWLKKTFADVRLDRIGEATYPMAYEDGNNKPVRMFSEEHCNYLYLRHGEISSSAEVSTSSCTKTITDTYPVRLVFHSIEKQAGNYADRRAVVISQLLGQYAYARPAGSNIWKVRFEVTGRNADKFEVFEEETSDVPITQIKDNHSIGAVDFDVIVSYTPSEDCLDDEIFCNLPNHAQVDPCPPVAEDVLTVSFQADETKAYINPAGVSMDYGIPDSFTNISGFGQVAFADQDGNALSVPFTVAGDRWVIATITPTASAASAFDIGRTINDGTGTKAGIAGENYRWTSLQGMTSDDDDSRLTPWVVRKTANSGILDDGASGAAISPPFKMRIRPDRNSGGQYYIGFTQTPYSLPANNVHTSISWGFLWNQVQNRLSAVESAVAVFTINSYAGTHTQDEELEIEHTGAQVIYKVNGVTIYTSLSIPTGVNCHGIVAPTYAGAKIEDCRIV